MPKQGTIRPAPGVAPSSKTSKKSEAGAVLKKKMLKNDEQSRNVYENKQNCDNKSYENSDINVEVTGILQKLAGWKGNLGTNCSKKPGT